MLEKKQSWIDSLLSLQRHQNGENITSWGNKWFSMGFDRE